MAVKLTKNRIALNEFTSPPTAASYSGANRGVLSPNRIPHTYFGENQIRDNSMLDTVVGAPGTMPSNITVLAAAGLTPSVKANQVINGLTYAVINFTGITNNVQVLLNMEDGTTITASNGQVWGYAAYVAVTGANTSHVTNAHLRLTQRTSAGAFIVNTDGTTFTPNATPARRLMLSTLAGGATVAFIQPVIRIVVQNTQTVDMDVYIAMHTLEQNINRNQPTATYGYAQPSVWIPDTPLIVDPRRFGAVVDAVQATNGSWTGTDNTTAIYKAAQVAARERGILRIPQGPMIFTGQLMDGSINCDQFQMQGFRDSRLVMKSSGQSANFQAFIFEGNIGSDGVGTAPLYYFTSAVSKGAASATFNDVTSLYVGQWVQLLDTLNVVISPDGTAAGTTLCYQGQAIQIDTIDTGTKIVTFKQAFEFDYSGSAVNPATTATNVQRYLTLASEIRVENLIFDYDITDPPSNTQYRMMFRNVGKHSVYGVDIIGAASGIAENGSLFADIDRVSFEDGTVLSYNMSISNGASFGKVRAAKGKNSRHLFQGSTAVTSIEAAHWIVSDSLALGHHLAPFSGHPGVRHVKYVGCHAAATGEYTPVPGADFAGFQLRGRNMEMHGCSTAGMRFGVEIEASQNNSVNDCVFSDCNIGVRVLWSTGVNVANTRIRNAKHAAVRIENQLVAAPYTPYGDMRIDVRVDGTTPDIADVLYAMRNPGQTVPTLASDWFIDVDAGTRKATYITVNVDNVTPNGAAFPGEYSYKQSTQTASFICMSGRNLTYIVAPGAGAIAVTVPSAATLVGEKSRVRFVKSGVGAGVITLTATAGNIDGAATKVLATFLTLESDGTNWFTIA